MSGVQAGLGKDEQAIGLGANTDKATCPRCGSRIRFAKQYADELWCYLCGPIYVGDVLGRGDELKRENCLGCGKPSRYSDLCSACATGMKYKRGPKWR